MCYTLPPMKTRDKTQVRIHPDLYQQICAEAEAEGLEKSDFLDEIVNLGLCMRRMMKSLKPTRQIKMTA